MRIVAAFVLLGVATAFAAAADKNDFKESMDAVETASKRNPPCGFVRKTVGLDVRYPSFLVDENPMRLPDRLVYELQFKTYAKEGVTMIDRILKPDDPSKCMRMTLIVVNETGELDAGVYAECDGEKREFRQSDGYGFDSDTGKMFGEENKPKWQAIYQKVLERTKSIARKCTT